MERPQHDSLVLLIERIAQVNEDKTPVLLLIMLPPKHQYSVYPPLNPCFNITADLLFPTVIFGLLICHHQDEFGETLSPCLSNPNRYDARLLYQPNQVFRHQGIIGHPGWEVIVQPLHQWCNNLIEISTGLPVAEKPTTKTDRICPPRSGPSGNPTSGLCQGVLRDSEGVNIQQCAHIAAEAPPDSWIGASLASYPLYSCIHPGAVIPPPIHPPSPFMLATEPWNRASCAVLGLCMPLTFSPWSSPHSPPQYISHRSSGFPRP